MPTYHYTARNERGQAVTGTLAAVNQEALADQLRRMGYLVTKWKEVAGGVSLDALLQHFRRIHHDDLVLFNVQLAKMVQVGIPLVTALETVVQQTENPRLRNAVQDVARTVEAGTGFSEALSHHPAVFSELFISMVRAGEASGKLDEILRRLAVFAKHQAELRQQLMTAMTYPVLLLMAGTAAIIFLVTGVIPQFMKIFLEANVPLPLPTRILYHVGQSLRYGWWAFASVLAAAGLGIQFALKRPAGRRWRDRWLLKLPVVGDLIRKAALSRFSRTLETLFSSGVPVLESLAIAEQTCGNVMIADVCRAAHANVQRGGTISEPLKASAEIPPMVAQMIAVGESSGTVDHMLAEIAAHYDELVQHGLRRVTALIEPVFLVLMGGLIALIMASVLLPLFRMVHVIK